MKAIVNGIDFIGGQNVISISFSREPDDFEYSKDVKFVLDEQGNPTTETYVRPYNTYHIPINVGVDKAAIMADINKKLSEHKAALADLVRVRKDVGSLEVKG